MIIRECRVHVHAGQGRGLVANLGHAVVVVLPEAPRQEPLMDALLAIVEAGATEGVAPGRRIARRVAGVLGGADPDDAPAFCLVAQAERGIALLVNGPVDVEIRGAGGSERLSGRDLATWVDRVVESPFDRLTVVASGQAASAPDPRSDLRSGVVRGEGAVVVPRAGSGGDAAGEEPTIVASPGPMATPAVVLPVAAEHPLPPVEPAAEPAAAPAVDFVAVSLVEPLPGEEPRPLPVAGQEPEPGSPEAGGPMVEGILCSRNHLNDPSAPFCSSCGISTVHQTHNLVTGPRPPLGVLILDDGATFVLDGDYTIGREPETDPEVQAARARPLVVVDPDRSVSRVHARVTLSGWDVRVADANSSNGTYVAGPGEGEWSRLPPQEPRTIPPGSRILIGQRPLVFESHHRA